LHDGSPLLISCFTANHMGPWHIHPLHSIVLVCVNVLFIQEHMQFCRGVEMWEEVCFLVVGCIRNSFNKTLVWLGRKPYLPSKPRLCLRSLGQLDVLRSSGPQAGGLSLDSAAQASWSALTTSMGTIRKSTSCEPRLRATP